jgi:type III restriction enzyme
MTTSYSKSPILNNPYLSPLFHYATDLDGALNYQEIREGRRIFSPEFQSIPTKQTGQMTLGDVNDMAPQYEIHIINLIRKEVGQWRKEGYRDTTRVSRDLLKFWFDNPDRSAIRKLFFAQQEAVETAVWLNEVAGKSNSGQYLLTQIKNEQQAVSNNPEDQLPRFAFKMATGTGKTVVMASLIVYHFLNRQEYKQDERFADYFLIIAPGITIRDRLGVLKVDGRNQNKNSRNDYYAVRDLIPPQYEQHLGALNAKLEITNYHSFMPRTLQGNKRSPMDGKIIGYDVEGNAIKQEALEDFNHVIKRVVGHFKPGRRLLILNDEAHHCYLPKASGRTQDNEEGDENAKAAVWFTGIRSLTQKFKVNTIYDLSATPYYLTGSGYPAYSLFGWVVTDFGLVEAMESGLVKIPFLPEKDDAQNIEAPILKNLYDHVKDELPKKGQRKKKSEAKKEGKTLSEEPPKLPSLVRGALDQFVNHYKQYEAGLRKKGESNINLDTRPPVFIAVCNNTSVSKEVYKHIAGYEFANEDGEVQVVEGQFDLFSNYDSQKRLKKKAPTLLIDSEALEDSGQVNDEFKKVFASEIEEFKREYAQLYGQGSADRISDAELLREVVNTVGQPGKLGGHIKCVVSVSMLTEGWDANTVTHIMGLRKFGSQLLCEQVAGRALRRMNYFLQGYDKDGYPTDDKRKIVDFKFPPEYAHIIGVPFKMFKGGTSSPVDPPDYTLVRALPERSDLEIEFPNLDGYRVDFHDDDLQYDLNIIEPYELDGSNYPTKTFTGIPFDDRKEQMSIETVLEKRDQEIIFILTKDLIRYKFSDDDGNPKYQLFPRLKTIVEQWYHTKVKLIHFTDEQFKKLLYYDDPKRIADHIVKAINPQVNTSAFIRPVFNYYNRWNGTRYVNGHTTKECFDTTKSHVNKVVMDSGWEGICAKVLEDMDEVHRYVKNQFLGFIIPYVKDGEEHHYYPDFIAVVKTGDSYTNLIIEVTGMNKEKADKKWYVENRWLPAVNAVHEKYEMYPWAFIEVANDIRTIKNELVAKIQSLMLTEPA